MEFGEFVHERFGPCVRGEDAADRGQGEGAEANGAFQGGANVFALIVSDQRQQVLRLQFALDLLGEQAIEERQRHGAEFGEALPQEPRSLLGIAGRMMALDQLPHPGLGAGLVRNYYGAITEEQCDS